MIKRIKQELQGSDYSFLKENEHLGDNIMILTLGGSYSYGTNTEDSDIDVRGVTLEREKEILGLSTFEQFEDKATDTTIYGFRKFVNLLLNSNPNVIEILGTKDEHIFHISEQGKMLRDNVDLFLSKKAMYSFGGYASQQLRRLENALVRGSHKQEDKEKHILNSINTQMEHFKANYKAFTDKEIELYIDKTDRDDYEKEIFMNIDLSHYPLRDFKNIYSEMSNIVKIYGELNHRNKKKSDKSLCKHAMHLVRLLSMGSEILEGKGINTYREDRDFLLEIRDGKYQNNDGSFDKSFFELVDKLEDRLQYASKHTELPAKPNFNKIEELVIEVNRKRL